MKIVKRLLILNICLILLTGCTNNRLKCEKNESNKTSKITVEFENNIVKTLELNEKINYDKLDAHIDLEYYDIKSKYSALDNINGVKYEVKENKNDISINLNVDYDILNDDKYSLITISKNTTKEEAINNLNSIGYICK